MAEVKAFNRISSVGLVVFLFSGLAAMMQLPACAAKSVTLAWNPIADTSVAGYRIYYGVASRRYTNSVSVGNATNATISGLIEGRTYFFAGTAYNTLGLESDYSGEAVYLVADTDRPAVAIGSPPDRSEFSAPGITLSGTAADNVRVEQILVQLGGGSFQSATVTRPQTKTATWSIPLKLMAGTNTVRVKAADSSGNESAVANRSFFLKVPSTLIVDINGSGSVTPNYNGSSLYVGRDYTMTATPSVNCLFNNWVSIANGATNVASADAIYTFLMQTNLILVANFTTNQLIEMAGTYSGLFSDTNGVAHESAGFFSLKTTSRLAFSGKLNVDGQVVGCAGKLDPSGKGIMKRLAARNGKTPLAVTVQFALDGSDRVTGAVSNTSGAWVAEMLGNRDVFFKAQMPNNYVGQYTMVIEGATNVAAGAAGDGYALITIKTNGQVMCKGGLGDGHKLTTVATTVSKNGDWPLYGTMYKEAFAYTNSNGVTKKSCVYKGSVIAWMNFANSPSRTLEDGRVIWIKKGWTNNIYPSGFTNEMQVLGSGYTPPAVGVRALDIATGLVRTRDGNLRSPFANNVTLGPDNKLTMTPPNVNMQKLTLTARSGLVKGSFWHPDNANATSVTFGAVLQDDHVARGYFVGTNQTGSIRLQRN